MSSLPVTISLIWMPYITAPGTGASRGPRFGFTAFSIRTYVRTSSMNGAMHLDGPAQSYTRKCYLVPVQCTWYLICVTGRVDTTRVLSFMSPPGRVRCRMNISESQVVICNARYSVATNPQEASITQLLGGRSTLFVVHHLGQLSCSRTRESRKGELRLVSY